MTSMQCVFFVISISLCICMVYSKLECARFPLCVDSNFKKPTIVETRFTNSFIYNVTLLERYSYYRCDPPEEKYGLGSDGKQWWVYHGCGGVFAVRECTEKPNTKLIQKPKDKIKSHHKEIDRKCREQLGLIPDEMMEKEKVTAF